MKRQVIVAQGTVEGLAAEDQGITVFRGVPFAQPPVGGLRWRAPQPALHGMVCCKPSISGLPRCSRRRAPPMISMIVNGAPIVMSALQGRNQTEGWLTKAGPKRRSRCN